MIQPKNQTENFLISITKNYEKFNKQTLRKAEETLEFTFTKSRKTFHFNSPIPIEEFWMIGLTSLEVYNSIFNMTDENSKFELYTETFDEFGFIELKDELEDIPKISDITTDVLEDDRLGPLIIKAYRKLHLENLSTDGYIIILMYYARSPFRDFESFLRMTGDLNDDDIQLILKRYVSHFVTYQIPPGIYTIKELSDAVC